MPIRLQSLPVSATMMLLLTTACGTISPGQRDSRTTSDDGGIVIQGIDLQDGRGDLINAMQGKVPNFRVSKPQAQACPHITIRSARILRAPINPHVYVDGARSMDTCILEMLRTSDVERIEVYPAGFTTRPGYGRHSEGLILVFMRGAGDHGVVKSKSGIGQ